ncbi:hypothetical protein [Sorangium sp. So ce513]|uniref:hypothetical protein n=1 Tax=Sorangium sp. So ce513 TaxID=3133315 RepID=UPI003F5E58BE
MTGEVFGGITSATGVGAAIGVPAIVVSTGLVVGGIGNIAAGIQGLSQALMPSGSGSTGPDGTIHNAANSVRLRHQLASQEIAGGHAFDKPVVNQGDFRDLGMTTREQFASHIERIMNNPSATRTTASRANGLLGRRYRYGSHPKFERCGWRHRIPADNWSFIL